MTIANSKRWTYYSCRRLYYSINHLAFGVGGVDGAEDADVIWHEYGHAIQCNLGTAYMFDDNETKSVAEGSSDYWALSYKRSLSSYNPVPQNLSYFNNCKFIVDDNNLFDNNHNFESHIKMNGVTGVNIYGCDFENNITSINSRRQVIQILRDAQCFLRMPKPLTDYPPQ